MLLENSQEIHDLFLYFGKKLFEVKRELPELYFILLTDLEKFYNKHIDYITKNREFISTDDLDFEKDEFIKNSLLDMCNGLDKILSLKKK